MKLLKAFEIFSQHFLTAALMIFSFCNSYAKERGGHSGGGGGSNVHDNFVVGNLNDKTKKGGIFLLSSGEWIRSVKGRSVQKRVQSLVNSNQLKAFPCPNDTEKIVLAIPQSLDSKFNIKIEPERNPILKLFNNTPLDPVDISIESVCGSQKIYESYSALALALWEIHTRNPHDGSADYLIEKSFALAGPIRLIVTSRMEHLPNKEGEQEESMWYDQDNDTIYFNQLNAACENINCFMLRQESDILVHEIAHSYLKRALKGMYPQAAVWHDLRTIGQINVDDGMGKFLNSQTSEEAAFIEALANVLEKRHVVVNHPFITQDISLHSLQDNGCFTMTAKGAQKIFSQIPFRAPLDNEVYLSSTLNTFLTGYLPMNSLKEEGNLNTEVNRRADYLWTSVSTTRQRAIIDAIANYKPNSIKKLAMAIDQQMGSDQGWRFLREYYFHDYRTQEDIGHEYTIQRQKNFLIIGAIDFSTKICGPQTNYEKSFSKAMRDEHDRELSIAKQVLADHVTSQSVVADIQLSVQQWENTYQRLQVEVLSTAANYEIERRYLHLRQNPRICGEYDEDFVRSIYKTIQDRYGTVIPLFNLHEILAYGCSNKNNSTDLNRKDLSKKIDDTLEAAKEIARTKTMPGTPEHYTYVHSWLKQKNILQTTTKEFVDLLIVLRVAKDTGL